MEFQLCGYVIEFGKTCNYIAMKYKTPGVSQPDTKSFFESDVLEINFTALLFCSRKCISFVAHQRPQARSKLSARVQFLSALASFNVISFDNNFVAQDSVSSLKSL